MSASGGASAQAIDDHYSLSNEFYALWLDPGMVYSCALWEEGDSLEQAQVRKNEHHIQASQASGKASVLDIGCGWGSVLRSLSARHGVGAAVGLTLSQAQAAHVRRLGLKNVDVRVESWSDHTPMAPYDAMISIGAFEHFARLEYTDAEKTECYRKFFLKAHELLKPGARMSLQTFAYGGARSRAEGSRSEATRFLAEEIFRETDPPRLVDIIQASEGIFEIVSLRNDRFDYARTCKEWLANLRSKKDQAAALVGAGAVERYEKYLSYSQIGFFTGNLDLYRIAFRRIESLKAAHEQNSLVLGRKALS